jgi:hypothetical protein
MNKRIEILLNSLGIDKNSFSEFIEWALSEQLVREMSKEINSDKYFNNFEALKNFRNLLKYKTQRNWSTDDLNKIFEAVKKKFKINFRDDIRYGDYLKLLWNNEHICKECGKKPPDIKLHIDHIIPVSLGGSSDSKNLQFLCSNCNLKKKNKLKGGKP